MRGRKPKPTALQDLHGDPSHLRRQLSVRLSVEPSAPTVPLAAPADNKCCIVQRRIRAARFPAVEGPEAYDFIANAQQATGPRTGPL